MLYSIDNKYKICYKYKYLKVTLLYLNCCPFKVKLCDFSKWVFSVLWFCCHMTTKWLHTDFDLADIIFEDINSLIFSNKIVCTDFLRK